LDSLTSCRLPARSSSSTCTGFRSAAIWRPVSHLSLLPQPLLKVVAQPKQVLSTKVHSIPPTTSCPQSTLRLLLLLCGSKLLAHKPLLLFCFLFFI
jgi:hypothetical protein